MLQRLLLITVVSVSAACRPASSAQATRPPTAETTQYAVYAEVLDSLFLHRQPRRIAVVEATIVDPPLGLEAPRNVGLMLDSVAPELRAALSRAVRAPVALRSAFPLQGEVTLLPPSSLYSQRDPTQGIGTDIAAFSAVGFAPDGRTAALYVQHHCGDLCGTASVVALARLESGRWQIRARRILLHF